MPHDLSDAVTIQETISAGIAGSEYGNQIFVTKDTTLDAGGAGKFKKYTSLDSVGDDFATSSEPYKAAQKYFGRTPTPFRPFVIARWTETAELSQLRGGTPAAVTSISGSNVTDGAFSIGSINVINISFSANDTYSQIAAAVQTALTSLTGLSTATCTFTNGRFIVSIPTTFDIEVATSPASGTDLSSSLGLDAASGATTHVGGDAETITQALANILAQTHDFTLLTFEQSVNGTADMGLAAGWALAGDDLMMSAETNESQALVTNDSTSQASILSATQNDNTWLTYSADADDYQAVQIAAAFAAINFSAPQNAITAKFQRMPGSTVPTLNDTQRAELQRKRINYMRYLGTAGIYGEGYLLATGEWIDVRFFVGWIKREIATKVADLLVREDRVPQTTFGAAIIQDEIKLVCEQAVSGGWLAPGTLSSALTTKVRQVTGDSEFSGELSSGYLIHVGSFADQSQADRDSREAPPYSVFLKGSGAIHHVPIGLNYEG